jgi:hypothetical protein
MSVPITLTIAVNGGAGLIVVATVYLILSGKLLTISLVNSLIQAYEKRIQEKDEQIKLWHDAHDTVKKSNDALIVSLYQSLELNRTTNSVLEALPLPSTSSSTTGSGSDGAPLA